MKEFFMSVVLVVSSFFEMNKTNVEIRPTPVITNVPTQIEMPTSEPTKVSTPSVIIKKITPMPTKIVKPTTSLNEEILKTIFGFTEIGQINLVLNDINQVKKYENEYYQKFKRHPMFKIKTIEVKKQYIIPSKNGPIVCTGAQLNSIYEENAKVEKEIEYQKMDRDCHFGSKQETEECKEWRRVNDPSKKDKKERTIYDLQREIMKAERSNDNYDGWTEKYCK